MTAPPPAVGPGQDLRRPRFVPATLVGCRVRELLSPNATGYVAATVSGAIYVSMGEGALVWVAPPGGVPHGRALLAPIPEDLAYSLTGATVRFAGSSLCIGDRLQVGLGGAPIWQPQAWPAPAAGALDQLDLMLGEFIHQQFDPVPGSDTWVATLASLASLPQPLLADGTRQLNEGDVGERVTSLAAALIGLGSGLTPTGDDFIGGLLFALHAAASGDSSAAARARACGQAVMRMAAGQTTAVSLALLHGYALGEGPEPLHRLAVSGLTGDAPQFERAADALLAIGSTTGGATLAGFAAGVRMARRQRHSADPQR